MTAPMNLTASQLRDLADALDRLSKIRREDNVDVCAYGTTEIRHVEADCAVRIRWDAEQEHYAIDDRNGD